ncbi:hypothetical protein EBZ39_05985, partial [bacterium]|nr:hypothetical protein [bacterium]
IKRIEKFMTGLDLNSFQAGGTPKVPLVLVSDCGFKEELLPLARCFGTSNILMVHVHRDGCTFQNDSRSYVKSGDIETVQVISGERAAYQDQIRLIVRSWLEGHGLFKLTQVETE